MLFTSSVQEILQASFKHFLIILESILLVGDPFLLGSVFLSHDDFRMGSDYTLMEGLSVDKNIHKR